MSDDVSSGYEEIAADYMAVRSSTCGRDLIRQWAATMPIGSRVLDVGAGFGEPLTSVLVDCKLCVSAIDASPTMVDAFQQRFPDIEIACETAQESHFFGKKFDAIMAVGLIFLLPLDQQDRLIRRLADALKPDGRLLFSSPFQRCEWIDVLTGQLSQSPGADVYHRILSECGFQQITNLTDEGGSYYYDARRS